MGGLIEPSPLGSSQEEQESNLRPILVAVMMVAVVVGLLLLVSLGSHKNASTPHPYAANLKISDLKLSAAENFVGASVTYVDGTVTNAGDKTVTHAEVHIDFKNSMGQIAQAEDVPLQILRTSGPYPDTVDLKNAPLGPGKSEPFRLTFEHVSDDWDHSYPQVQVTSVELK